MRCSVSFESMFVIFGFMVVDIYYIYYVFVFWVCVDVGIILGLLLQGVVVVDV